MPNRYEFIISLIKEAGERVLLARDREFSVASKEGGDWRNIVTSVDLEVNHFLIASINAAFPGENVYSEETKDSEQIGSYWSLDPLDGTSNFARGIPHYAVVISYIEHKQPIVGAIYNPVTKELFSFEKDKGAFLNGAQIKVSEITALKDAYVMLHIGRKDEVREWGLALQRGLLEKAKKNMNLGSSALDLAFLASGRVDVVVYGTMTTLDVAVATALVRAAGGEVYSLDGAPIQFLSTPQQIIGTANKELFDALATL